MKVHRLRVDVSRFQTLVLMEEEPWEHDDQMTHNGLEKVDWVVPRVRVFNPLRERGNFFRLGAGALVFDERARETMLDLFEMAGQVLPLEAEHEVLFLLNVTECVNSLNADASEWTVDPRTDRRLGLRRYVFYERILSESSIFKIPETVRGEVLTYSGVKDPNDEFWGRYESSGLTGLKPQELFST